MNWILLFFSFSLWKYNNETRNGFKNSYIFQWLYIIKILKWSDLIFYLFIFKWRLTTKRAQQYRIFNWKEKWKEKPLLPHLPIELRDISYIIYIHIYIYKKYLWKFSRKMLMVNDVCNITWLMNNVNVTSMNAKLCFV